MEFYDRPFSWEFQHPNWRSHVFQRGRLKTTNQKLTLSHPFLKAWRFWHYRFDIIPPKVRTVKPCDFSVAQKNPPRLDDSSTPKNWCFVSSSPPGEGHRDHRKRPHVLRRCRDYRVARKKGLQDNTPGISGKNVENVHFASFPSKDVVSTIRFSIKECFFFAAKKGLNMFEHVEHALTKTTRRLNWWGNMFSRRT